MTVSGLTIAAIMGILLLVFIFSGYYLFAALGGVAILSGLAFWGPGVFQTVYFSIFKYCKDYNLLAVPLFVLMGRRPPVRRAAAAQSVRRGRPPV